MKIHMIAPLASNDEYNKFVKDFALLDHELVGALDEHDMVIVCPGAPTMPFLSPVIMNAPRIATIGAWYSWFPERTEAYDDYAACWTQLYNEWCQEYDHEAADEIQEDTTPDETPAVGTAPQFVDFAEDLHASALSVFKVANREYSDANAWTTNFDTATHFLRMSLPDAKPRDAVLVYLMKSIFSIAKNHTERQDMRSRYIDAINYLTFMAWMDENEHDAEMWTTASAEIPSPREEEPRQKPTNAEIMQAYRDAATKFPVVWPVYNNVAPPPIPPKNDRTQDAAPCAEYTPDAPVAMEENTLTS